MNNINSQNLIEKKISINNEDIAYFDSELGDITLFLIHGAFINKTYWTNQISYFSPHFRVVAVDLAGHGNSSHRRHTWTIEEYGKDVNDLIKALALNNVILIGHSVGADIALEVASLNSTSIVGIIGVDYFKNLTFEMPQEFVDELNLGLKNDFSNTCEYYALTQLMTPETEEKLAARLKSAFREMNPSVGAPLIENTFKYSVKEQKMIGDLFLKLNLINVTYLPTDEDALERFTARNYMLRLMKGTCHYPMLENPVEFNLLLNDVILRIKTDENR